MAHLAVLLDQNAYGPQCALFVYFSWPASSNRFCLNGRYSSPLLSAMRRRQMSVTSYYQRRGGTVGLTAFDGVELRRKYDSGLTVTKS